MSGIAGQAGQLNNMINQIMNEADDDSKSLIVSHDLSISPAMARRGIPLASIDFLNGYVIRDDGSVNTYSPS